ncbi:serine/threonine protein kinase [Barrientosiimonas humi]|uniref:non-specific serine/threonine protein kinase n=1 Tax=Barrientosiimonas humi TaxID=999931 RepID=A0A542XB64_9MICO|nr:serine/threonine-protein kinase [Barrientosiimonas humi]TQL33089.1 serine/threonine protein kinase [Barrientosiimonas humi]CAG7573079.1 Serine/threonine-protein kinase PknH [Barrientosiimonas humi]
MVEERGSRAGSRFGPYELKHLLGRGGMGDVYEALDTVKERVVALKLLPEALAEDQEYRERFRREARTAARLQEPHVIPIHDFGEIDGRLFIDMRLVRGRDLRSLLKQNGPLGAARSVAVVSQVAAALDAAHRDGLVHRDIKPENVLITDGEFAYLADFGIASSAQDTRLTGTGSAVGSVAYMAPERFRDEEVTAAADIYSLGCVLYECLTGRTPFSSSTIAALVAAHLYDAPPAASQQAGVDARLDGVVARALAKDPRDRFPSAGALADAARGALSAQDQEAATSIMRRSAGGGAAGGLAAGGLAAGGVAGGAAAAAGTGGAGAGPGPTAGPGAGTGGQGSGPGGQGSAGGAGTTRQVPGRAQDITAQLPKITGAGTTRGAGGGGAGGRGVGAGGLAAGAGVAGAGAAAAAAGGGGRGGDAWQGDGDGYDGSDGDAWGEDSYAAGGAGGAGHAGGGGAGGAGRAAGGGGGGNPPRAYPERAPQPEGRRGPASWLLAAAVAAMLLLGGVLLWNQLRDNGGGAADPSGSGGTPPATSGPAGSGSSGSDPGSDSPDGEGPSTLPDQTPSSSQETLPDPTESETTDEDDSPSPEPSTPEPSSPSSSSSETSDDEETQEPSGPTLSGAGYDRQGWTHSGAARCNADDNARMVTRTASAYVVICARADNGNTYYRAYQTDSGNAIEIGFPVRSGGGWTVSNDGYVYRITPSSLTIRNGSKEVLNEATQLYDEVP